MHSALHCGRDGWMRQYDEQGAAFERTACGRYAPLRLDFAIEAALCTWWILSGWEDEDREAVWEAVCRAQRSSPDSA